jgi:hypothetical protein
VTVTLPFNSVRWVLLNQIASAQNLTPSANGYSMADVPFAVNTTIPSN